MDSSPSSKIDYAEYIYSQNNIDIKINNAPTPGPKCSR